MILIEQAILASSREEPSGGCRLLAASPGLGADDRRDLAAWGPSHACLWEPHAGARSVNFHRLHSGNFCISRTTLTAGEDRGHDPQRVSTHCLVVTSAGLGEFAGNPLALLEEAAAAGVFDPPAFAPESLPPLQLDGGAAAVDLPLLEQVAGQLGPQRLAALVQAALDGVCLAVSGGRPAYQLVAAVLNCLPVECRHAFSFSTELKFSSRRPFRIISLPRGQAERDWLAQCSNVTLLDLDREAGPGAPLGDWARLIERVADRRAFAFLASQLAQARPALVLEDLPALGLQLCDELDTERLDGGGRETSPSEKAGSSAGAMRAHAAHHRFQKSGEGATAVRSAPVPSKDLQPDAPEVVETLEALDDAVYDAIHGQAAALERLQALWPTGLAHLGEQFLAESQAQYLRYALTVWENCVDAQGVHDPGRAVQALEVLCVLFDEH